MTSATLIDVHALSKNYGRFPALQGLSLQVGGGKVVGLLGENGCGKTTLLKILAGVLSGYDGKVQIDGNDIGPKSKAVVAFLPDVSTLPDAATAEKCMDMYADFFADFDREKARDLIEFFGLRTDMRLKEMSKGMREKVQIALVLGRRAKVYLLDEPISGVDPAARDAVLKAIMRHLEEDSLVLISTHLIHDLEPILDSVIFMRHGQVLLQGDVDDLRQEHAKSIDELFREVYQWSHNS